MRSLFSISLCIRSSGALFAIGSILLLASNTPLCAVEPSFDAKGLNGLGVNGVNVLKQGQPHLQFAVFETTSLDDKGIKQYQFEKVSEPGKVSFNSDSKTSTETFSWGRVDVTYKPSKDRLDFVINITNQSSKTLADFQQTLGLFEFPVEPTGWKGGRGVSGISLDDLALTPVDAGKVKLLVCNATMNPPFHLGFGATVQKGKPVYPLIVHGGVHATEPNAYTIEPNGLPRIPAGVSLTLEVTLRQIPPDGKLAQILPDVYEKFRASHKSTLVWPDRRPIGMVFHSSSSKQHQSKTNPRGWLGNPKLNVLTPAGRAQFRTEMLKAAAQGVKTIQATGGQGMIFWDLEGEENPHPISYIGDPTMTKKLAPEMDQIADEYFKVYRDAGLRVGLTLRPSQVYFNESKKKWDHGTGSDGGPGRGDFYSKIRPKDLPWYKFYPVCERLSDRITYAKKRLGCTIFYVDTNGLYQQVGEKQQFTWFLLQASVFKRLNELHPDVLIIPELLRDNQTYHAAYAAHAAPYLEVDLKGYRTPSRIRELLPNAFSIINISDGDLAKYRSEIKAGVAAGDIVLFRGWFADKRNAWVKELYEEVKQGKK